MQNMTSLIEKGKFKELLEKMIQDKDYLSCVFLIYSDGVRWGVEVYKGEKVDLDESKVASMWWNISMKNAYKLSPRLTSKISFSFTFYNSNESSKDKILSQIDNIEDMDKIFHTELSETSLYTSLESD